MLDESNVSKQQRQSWLVCRMEWEQSVLALKLRHSYLEEWDHKRTKRKVGGLLQFGVKFFHRQLRILSSTQQSNECRVKIIDVNMPLVSFSLSVCMMYVCMYDARFMPAFYAKKTYTITLLNFSILGLHGESDQPGITSFRKRFCNPTHLYSSCDLAVVYKNLDSLTASSSCKTY